MLNILLFTCSGRFAEVKEEDGRERKGGGRSERETVTCMICHINIVIACTDGNNNILLLLMQIMFIITL